MPKRRQVCLLILIAGAISVAHGQLAKPDLIVHHGRIISVDADFNIVEAMAIQGDRIAAAGSNNKTLALSGTGTFDGYEFLG